MSKTTETNLTQQAEVITQKATHRKRWQKVVSGLCAITVFVTTYALILPAITAESQTFCGYQEEHTHGDACYERVLTCGYGEEATTAQTVVIDAGHTHDDSCYDADGALICGETERDAVTEEAAPAHVHTDDCYTLTLTCQKEEHKHDDTCFSNPNADVETASAWEATLPQKLTGNWAEDVLAIAESQLGYTESQKNYQVVNGRHKGYSRYGAWYGDPYGDWCAMFVSFCLRYAQVDAKLMPIDANCASWIRQLDKLEIYHETYNALNEAQRAARLEELRAALAEQGRTDEAAALEALPAYLPAPGDLIFFDWEADGESDHIGLVYELLDANGKSITAALARAESEEALAAAQAMEPAQVRTIEGNASDRVQYVTYALDSAKIAGYGTLPENPDPIETDTLPEAAEETEAPEEPVPAEETALPAAAPVRRAPAKAAPAHTTTVPTITGSVSKSLIVLKDDDSSFKQGSDSLRDALVGIGNRSGSFTVVFTKDYTITQTDLDMVKNGTVNAQKITYTSTYNNGTSNITRTVTLPDNSSDTTYTSGNFYLPTETEFHHISFSNPQGSCRIVAQGHKLIMGEGITQTNATMQVYGGSGVDYTGNSDVTVLSGQYNLIMGGNHLGAMTGTTHVYFGGTATVNYLCGGDNTTAMGANSKVIMEVDGADGAKINNFLYVAGYASSIPATATVDVTIRSLTNNFPALEANRNMSFSNGATFATGTITFEGDSHVRSALRTCAGVDVKLASGATLQLGTTTNCELTLRKDLILEAGSKLVCATGGTKTVDGDLIVNGAGAEIDIFKTGTTTTPITIGGAYSGSNKLALDIYGSTTIEMNKTLLSYSIADNAKPENYTYARELPEPIILARDGSTGNIILSVDPSVLNNTTVVEADSRRATSLNILYSGAYTTAATSLKWTWTGKNKINMTAGANVSGARLASSFLSDAVVDGQALPAVGDITRNNSSRAVLTSKGNGNIVAAYLIMTSTARGTWSSVLPSWYGVHMQLRGPSGRLCDVKNIPPKNAEVINVGPGAQLAAGGNVSTANLNNLLNNEVLFAMQSNTGIPFMAISDVTRFVQEEGFGLYWGIGIPHRQFYNDCTQSWTLFVVEEDPTMDLPTLLSLQVNTLHHAASVAVDYPGYAIVGADSFGQVFSISSDDINTAAGDTGGRTGSDLGLRLNGQTLAVPFRPLGKWSQNIINDESRVLGFGVDSSLYNVSDLNLSNTSLHQTISYEFYQTGSYNAFTYAVGTNFELYNALYETEITHSLASSPSTTVGIDPMQGGSAVRIQAKATNVSRNVDDVAGTTNTQAVVEVDPKLTNVRNITAVYHNYNKSTGATTNVPVTYVYNATNHTITFDFGASENGQTLFNDRGDVLDITFEANTLGKARNYENTIYVKHGNLYCVNAIVPNSSESRTAESSDAFETYDAPSTTLTITKTVSDGGTGTYAFTASISDDGTPVILDPDTATPARYTVNSTTGVVSFNLSHGGSVTLPGIPVGATVTLTETQHDGYSVLIKQGSSTLASGDTATFTINSNTTIEVVNNHGVELPHTGGGGTTLYTLSGLALMAPALVYGISLRRKRERRKS